MAYCLLRYDSHLDHPGPDTVLHSSQKLRQHNQLSVLWPCPDNDSVNLPIPELVLPLLDPLAPIQVPSLRVSHLHPRSDGPTGEHPPRDWSSSVQELELLRGQGKTGALRVVN